MPLQDEMEALLNKDHRPQSPSTSPFQQEVYETLKRKSADKAVAAIEDLPAASGFTGNVLAPLWNSLAVEPANIGVGAANTALYAWNSLANKATGNPSRPTELQKFSTMSLAAAEPGSAASYVQQTSAVVGSIINYAIAGKVTGSVMRRSAELIPLETKLLNCNLGAATRKLAGNHQLATVLGATSYAAFKDPKQGETRFSNAVGTFISFSCFEAGNSIVLNPRSSRLAQTGQRYLIGSYSSMADAQVTSLILKNHLADVTTLFASAHSGGLLNALLPSGQKTVDTIDAKLFHSKNVSTVAIADTFSVKTVGGDKMPLWKPEKALEFAELKTVKIVPEVADFKAPENAPNSAHPQAETLAPKLAIVKPDALQTAESSAARSDRLFFQQDEKVTGIQVLDKLINRIFEKFSPRAIRRTELRDVIRSLPEEDQALGLRFLQASAPFASSQNLREYLKKIAGEHKSPPTSFTMSAQSAGNFVGYFMKKSHGAFGGLELRSIDQLENVADRKQRPHNIAIFDDLSQLVFTSKEKELFGKFHNVFIIDTGCFERGVNILDMARGPEAIAAKLQQLIAESKLYKSSPDTVAAVMNQGRTRVVNFGGNVKLVSPPLEAVTQSAKTPPLDSAIDATYQDMVRVKSSKQAIAKYLQKFGSPEQQVLPAELLADGAEYRSIKRQVEAAQLLQQKLFEAASAKNISRDNILFVTDADPGGSTHMTTYLYKEANRTPGSQFRSIAELRTLQSDGKLSDKMVVYLDDIAGSGEQGKSFMEKALDNRLPRGKHFVIGLLGAYSKGIAKIEKHALVQKGDAKLIYVDRFEHVLTKEHPFYAKLPREQQKLLTELLAGDWGFSNVGGAVANSHMVPDTNIGEFQRFAKHVLGLPN